MSVYGINIPWLQKGVGVDSITPSGGFAVRGDVQIYPSGDEIKVFQSGNRIYIGEHIPAHGELWATGKTTAFGGVVSTIYPISGIAQTGQIMKDFYASGSGFLVCSDPDGMQGSAICNGNVTKPGGGPKNIIFYLTKNGAIYPTTRRPTFPGNAQPMNFALQTTVNLVSGDYVGLSAENIDNGETFIVTDYNLVIKE